MMLSAHWTIADKGFRISCLQVECVSCNKSDEKAISQLTR
jgi:hypothetical protein